MEKAASEVNGRTVTLNETQHYSVSEIEVALKASEILCRATMLPEEHYEKILAARVDAFYVIRDGLAEIRARHDKGRK